MTRIYGFYLLGKTKHRQEIISHPKWIVVDELTTMEKLFLANSLGHDFNEKSPAEKAFLRAIAATDILYNKYKPFRIMKIHFISNVVCFSGTCIRKRI